MQGGNELATRTIDLIRGLISRRKLTTVDDLIVRRAPHPSAVLPLVRCVRVPLTFLAFVYLCQDFLHHVGATLTAARPQEQVTGNVTRRILRIVREEGKGLVDEIEREERSAVASAAPSVAASPSASPPTRSQSSSPPPSEQLKRSFSTVNIDVSLSLHSLLDQPSSTASLSSLSSDPSSSPPRLSLSPATSAPSSAFPPQQQPTAATVLRQQRSRGDVREREEDRQQRQWLRARLMPAIIEEIGLLHDEIVQSELVIASQATEHIYANETILTYGVSGAVTAFLKEAARFRRFEVMVVETAPSYAGHQQAMLLAAPPHPIQTTVITDSAVYAIMPAVNKCIVGYHAVMANGALIVPSGGFNIALAARAHSVPLVVLTGLHALSPLYSHHSSQHNTHQSPSQLLSYDTGGHAHDLVRVENPTFEEVSADMVDLLITNVGGHSPSYIYRLLSDHYHAMDAVLQVKEGVMGSGGGGAADEAKSGKGKEKEKGKGERVEREAQDGRIPPPARRGLSEYTLRRYRY